MSRTTDWLLWPLDVVARPERLVATESESDASGYLDVLLEGTWLIVVYMLNLLMYAAPLAVAGVGVPETMTAPAPIADALSGVVADPDALFRLIVGLIQNSAFLLAATLLTFGTFHVGVWLAGASRGILQSLRAVTYSTGIYLAIMFTLVMTAATSDSVTVAEEFLLYLQSEFFYYFFDLLNAGLELPGGRRDPVALEGMSTLGRYILLGLVLSGLYYLYVLYVGARTGHGASRIAAALATAFVVVSPALYVIGLLLFELWFAP